MQGSSEKQLPNRRKPYAKPALMKVQLKPQEAILGACKNTGTVGPSAANCGFGAIICQTINS
jgi:hypothetical protein